VDKKSERYRFSHLRSRSSRKPHVTCPPVRFFRCPVCGGFAHVMAEGAGAPVCCGQEMELLLPREAVEVEPEIKLDYLIIGSLNENAVKVMWDCRDPEEKPAWIYLRTFIGGQIKYMTPKKRSPAIFGLTEEDAYAYCDKDPCVECAFRCKRGLELYYYFERVGLVRLPLDRMATPQPVEKQAGTYFFD